MGQGQCNALPAPVSFRWGRGCVTQGVSNGSPFFRRAAGVYGGDLLPPPGRETAEKLLPPAPVTAQPISHPSLSPGAGGLMVRPTGIPDCGRRHTSTSAILRIWQGRNTAGVFDLSRQSASAAARGDCRRRVGMATDGGRYRRGF
jgi:hypothetical protein